MISAMKNPASAANDAAAPATNAPPRRALRGITKGRIVSPPRVLLYSVEGIGKTTFASGAPNPIYLGKETGTEQLDIARLPEPTHWRDAPATAADGGTVKLDCFSLVEDLLYADHDYQTFVVDTLDWLEPLVFAWVCSNSRSKGKGVVPVANINEAFGGYGKGYDVALDEWRKWISLIERLRTERKMTIVLLAHAIVKRFNNPEGEDFDAYQLKMHDKSAGIFREWCDAVLFASLELFSQNKSDDDEGKGKRYGVGSCVRYLYTQRRPAHYAKNRYNLPERMALEWKSLDDAIKAHSPASVGEIVTRIHELAAFISADLQTEVPGMIERCGGNADKLVKVVNWIQAQMDDASSVGNKENGHG